VTSKWHSAFLINPISGGGEGIRVHNHLPEIMQSIGIDAQDWVSEYTQKDGGQDQIIKLLENSDRLIVVGGDGTMSSVIQAVSKLKIKEVILGLVPLGTGNDLARHLNIYNAYVNRGLFFLLRKLLQADSKPFDLWSVNNMHVMSAYFSAGIDAKVAHDFNKDRSDGVLKSGSVLRNKLHYLKSFWKDRNHHIQGNSTLEYQDPFGTWHKIDVSGYRTLIVGNIDSFASGANPFRGSDSSDGLLEIVPVKNLGRFAGSILFGTNKHSANLFTKIWLPSLHARRLKFSIDSAEFLQLDGEDMTGKIPGEIVNIEPAGQVRMLYLPSDLYN
jgi:diacylglycerol kinase family enzyme